MRRTLLLVAAGLLVWSSRMALAQDAARGGAYPMNTLERIAQADSGASTRLEDLPAGTVIITTYGDENPGRAGAFPMNIMDRIKAAEMNATRRYRTAPSAVRSQPAPTAVSNPDGWRYQRYQNRWWYYGADGQWLYWQGNRWNKPVTPKAAAE